MKKKKKNEKEKKVSKHLIAFVDILGYKELLDRCGEDNALKIVDGAITKTYDEAKAHLESEKYKIKSFHKKAIKLSPLSKNFNKKQMKLYIKEINEIKIDVFSDNILITIELPEDYDNHLLYSEFRKICKFLIRLQNIFFVEHDLLIRGGVVLGNLYKDSRYVFGTRLIEAYFLESKIANYPRIVICDELQKKIYRHSKYEIDNIENRYKEWLNELKNVKESVKSWEVLKLINKASDMLSMCYIKIAIEYSISSDLTLEQHVDYFHCDEWIVKLIELELENVFPMLNRRKILRFLWESKEFIERIVNQTVILFRKRIKSNINKTFYKDRNGIFFLNYFLHPYDLENVDIRIVDNVIISPDDGSSEKIHSRMRIHANKIRKSIAEFERKMNNTTNSVEGKQFRKILDKYYWLRDYHNEICDIESETYLKLYRVN